MKLTSPVFQANTMIPKKYTCQGDNVNPTLTIEGVPSDTKSLALIMDDPDAPVGTWVHWVVYNIPVGSKIEENSASGKQAKNSARHESYGGPCPPSGTHRYFFKLYSLDTELSPGSVTDKSSLEKAMGGHILDKAELVGLYKKS